MLASLSFMFILYYFLARDEERRMLGQFGEGYSSIWIAPACSCRRRVENWLLIPFRSLSKTLCDIPPCFSVIVVVIGCGFLLRFITLHSTLRSAANITLFLLFRKTTALAKGGLEILAAESAQSEFILSKGLSGLSDARRLCHAGYDRRYRR